MRFLKPRPFGGWRDLTIVRWRHVALILAAALVVIVPCAYVGSQFYRYKRHRYVSDRMEIAITRLALTCPEDLTEDQWAYCIGWTWNLRN